MIFSTFQDHYLIGTKGTSSVGTLSYTQYFSDEESSQINWNYCDFLVDNLQNTGSSHNYESLIESRSSATDSVSLDINEKLNYISHEGVNIPKPSEIIDFLIVHQSSIDFIVPIASLVLKYFRHNSQIFFELNSDPEIDDTYLVFYIRQQPYQEDIINKIDDLEDEIYKKFAGGTNGLILITTDFNFPAK